ncbi:unnamed protein product [Knipowitschia caucasica]|uniref:C-type lectin domain-containing protein n=1 Tax=Knipowitschia caucasica TaxID=637954 RepID=A0AAV2LJ61_KNICA
MKTFLLLSLLCGVLVASAADAVPVEAAAVQEEESEVSVPDGGVLTQAEPEALADEVLTEVAEVESAAPEPMKAAVKSVPSLLSNSRPPSPVVQAVANTNCPAGWRQYNGACYNFVNLSYTWNNADAMCESLGASLASAHDLGEYSFLKQLTWRAGFLTAWIGGYRFQGFWKWDDGSAFNYNNWFYHTSSSYDCVFLNSPESRGWSSERCHLLHPFICSTRFTHC